MHFRRSTAVVAAFFLAVVGYLPSVATAQAAARTATLVGSLQSELGCDRDWNPECTATDLTQVGTSSTYEKTFTVPAGYAFAKLAFKGRDKVFQLLVAALVWIVYRHREIQPKRVRVDFVGLGLLAVWVGSLQMMIGLGRELDWFDAWEIVALAISAVVGLVLFLAWDRLHGWLSRVRWLDRIGPAASYDYLLHAIPRLAAWQTRHLQTPLLIS